MMRREFLGKARTMLLLRRRMATPNPACEMRSWGRLQTRGSHDKGRPWWVRVGVVRPPRPVSSKTSPCVTTKKCTPAKPHKLTSKRCPAGALSIEFGREKGGCCTSVGVFLKMGGKKSETGMPSPPRCLCQRALPVSVLSTSNSRQGRSFLRRSSKN